MAKFRIYPNNATTLSSQALIAIISLKGQNEIENLIRGETGGNDYSQWLVDANPVVGQTLHLHGFKLHVPFVNVLFQVRAEGQSYAEATMYALNAAKEKDYPIVSIQAPDIKEIEAFVAALRMTQFAGIVHIGCPDPVAAETLRQNLIRTQKDQGTKVSE